MIRRTRPSLEPLEGRSLLSGLAYSLTTNQAIYQLGQPVEMTFQETNVSSQPVSVEDGPSIDGFTISRDGAVVWQSNSGINPLYIALETLQPGQSLTLTATWNGIPIGGSAPASGTFVISNQLAPTAATATVAISSSTSPSPAPPVTDPPPTSAPPVAGSSPIALSVATNHPTYHRDHPVRITLRLHNVGRSPIELTPDSNLDGFTVLQGSTEIWHSARPVVRRIKPGHSIKLTADWNGRPGQPDATIAPGTYTIEAVEGGEAVSTTVQITA
jgi:hypothetical protein